MKVKKRRIVLSFELSAIDLILALSVALLLILYMIKLSGSSEEKKLEKVRTKVINTERAVSVHQDDYFECPRGFGKIKIFSENNSISERCLGCYMIIECYSKNPQ